jgi:hypothetical protein
MLQTVLSSPLAPCGLGGPDWPHMQQWSGWFWRLFGKCVSNSCSRRRYLLTRLAGHCRHNCHLLTRLAGSC